MTYELGVSPDHPIWTIFSYATVHRDDAHWFLNMVFILALCVVKPRFMHINLICGSLAQINTGLMFWLWAPVGSVLIGASGVVFGMLGSIAPYHWQARGVILIALLIEWWQGDTSMIWHAIAAATGFATVALWGLTKKTG